MIQWPALILACLVLACDKEPSRPPTGFSGESALRHATTLMSFGPRVPGTDGWRKSGDWIVARMRETADTVFVQEWTHTLATGARIPQRNIIASFRPEASERVLYVTHWDTRPQSDRANTAAERALPVPGANDNASGVGLLIALGELLKSTPPAVGVDFLFTDGEDWGSFDSMTDVLIGSSYFARNIPWPNYRPLFGVVWDMIGDRDLQIYQEINSVRQAPEVVQEPPPEIPRTVGHEAPDAYVAQECVPRGCPSRLAVQAAKQVQRPVHRTAPKRRIDQRRPRDPVRCDARLAHLPPRPLHRLDRSSAAGIIQHRIPQRNSRLDPLPDHVPPDLYRSLQPIDGKEARDKYMEPLRTERRRVGLCAAIHAQGLVCLVLEEQELQAVSKVGRVGLHQGLLDRPCECKATVGKGFGIVSLVKRVLERRHLWR